MPIITKHFDSSLKIGNQQSKPVFSPTWLIQRSHYCKSTEKKMQGFCISWNRKAGLRNLVCNERFFMCITVEAVEGLILLVRCLCHFLHTSLNRECSLKHVDNLYISPTLH